MHHLLLESWLLFDGLYIDGGFNKKNSYDMKCFFYILTLLRDRFIYHKLKSMT